MSGSEWMAVLAVLLSAISILPGTLGILMLTNRVAATVAGARLIYQYSFVALAASVLLILWAWVRAVSGDGLSMLLVLSTVVYVGVCIFGFLMHTRFLFRPIRKPVFVSMDEAIERFDLDEEVVGVVDSKGTPYAFLARLARRPHIVYQPEGDAPFIMTHCILSHSSMAYETTGGFRQPQILITAALSNNMVLYEKTNQCSVIQIQNQGRDGGLQLATMPTVMVSLGTWKALFPASKVWVRSIEWRDIFYLKVLARADVIDIDSPTLVYPLMQDKDDRLPLKSLVMGVEINREARAYPEALFAPDTLIHDELGGTPLLLVSAFDGDYIQMFDRRRGALGALTFGTTASDNRMRDTETGSEWTCLGECISGPNQGEKLEPVPHYNKIFWFTWADYHSGTDIYVREPAAPRVSMAG